MSLEALAFATANLEAFDEFIAHITAAEDILYREFACADRNSSGGALPDTRTHAVDYKNSLTYYYRTLRPLIESAPGKRQDHVRFLTHCTDAVVAVRRAPPSLSLTFFRLSGGTRYKCFVTMPLHETVGSLRAEMSRISGLAVERITFGVPQMTRPVRNEETLEDMRSALNPSAELLYY